MEIKNNRIVATPRSKYHKYLFGGSSGSSSGGSISIDTNNFVKKTGETSQTVEGDFIVNGNIISTGEVSAYGAGSGAGGGTGLITSVLGSAGLGVSYLDTDLTNTFNAYTINLINSNLTSALGRIGALETSTPNVAWGTATGQYSPLTINSVTRNLSLDGHTHSYLPLSGGNLTGALTINGSTVWHAGNDGAGSGLDADLLRGVAPSDLAVLSATKLANTRTIWGQSFNGEGNVSGALSGATTGSFTSTISATTGIFSNLTANYIPKHTAGGLANSLIYDNGTNVGIGRTDAAYKLDVNGTFRTAGIAYFGNNLRIQDSGSYSELIGGAGKSIKFYTNDGIHNPLTLLSSGNICVNTSADYGYKLDVNGTGRFTDSLLTKNIIFNSNNTWGNLGSVLCTWGNNGGYPTLYGSSAERWVMHINPHISYVQNGIGEYTGAMNGATIRFAGNYGATTAWDLGVGCNSVGSDKFSIGRSTGSFVSIDNTGNVGIGTTSPSFKLDVNGSGHYASELFLDYGLRISNAAGSGEGISLFAESSTNPNYGLMFARTVYKGTHGAVNGDWATYFTMSPDAGRGWIFTNSPTTTGGNVVSISNTGNITASGEVTAYSASDIRLKANIKPIISAIDVINKLNPVTYNWNEKAKELNPLKTDSTEYGLIAQELEEVLPELVHPIYDGKYKSIDYVKIVPLLIGAIKELKSEIDTLKNNNIIHIN